MDVVSRDARIPRPGRESQRVTLGIFIAFALPAAPLGGYIDHGPLLEGAHYGAWHAFQCGTPPSPCEEGPSPDNAAKIRGTSGVFGGAGVCDDQLGSSGGDLYCQAMPWTASECIEGEWGQQLVQTSFNDGQLHQANWYMVQCVTGPPI